MELQWSFIRGIRWLVFGEFEFKRLLERRRDADACNVSFSLQVFDEINDVGFLEQPVWV